MPKYKIIQAIQKYQKIIIHRHVRPDPDAIGSQCGLKSILQHTFPKKRVYAVGEEDPSLTFLARMDQIDDEEYKGALVIVCDKANKGRISNQRYHLCNDIIHIDHRPYNDPYGYIRWVNTSASSTSEMIYELFKAGEKEVFHFNSEAARLLYSGIVGDTGRFLFPSTRNVTFQ